MPRLTLLFVVLVMVVAPARAEPGTKVFALIVGNNDSRDDGVAPLAFADDDAARYAEFFGHYAEETVLLSVMDRETQRLHPELVSRSAAPTLERVRASWQSLSEKAAAVRAAGGRAEQFFIYTGHGNVDNAGRGYLNLRDARFTREDLLRDIVGTHRADALHVVLDACHAYLVVHERGRLEKLVEATRAHLDVPQLADHPEVGFVLATSGEAVTHEWKEYRGGVFSHELRTAMLGAADVNADARIEYSEVAAFIAAANQQVKDPRGRLDVYVKPPAGNERRPLVNLGRLKSRRALLVNASVTGRWTVEDRRGIRYADFHKASDYQLALELLPDREYWVRSEEGEALVSQATSGSIPFSLLRFESRGQSERGALREAFREGLFAAPYGDGFYRGYVSSRDMVAVPKPEEGEEKLPPGLEPPAGVEAAQHGAPVSAAVLAPVAPAPSRARTLALGAAGGAAIAGTMAALGFSYLSIESHGEWSDLPVRDDRIKARAELQERYANAGWVVAGTSAAVALVLWIAE